MSSLPPPALRGRQPFLKKAKTTVVTREEKSDASGLSNELLLLAQSEQVSRHALMGNPKEDHEFQCMMCSTSWNTSRLLYRHVKEVHRLKCFCHTCQVEAGGHSHTGRVWSCAAELVRHWTRVWNGPRRFPCTLCGTSAFVTRGELDQHINRCRTHHTVTAVTEDTPRNPQQQQPPPRASSVPVRTPTSVDMRRTEAMTCLHGLWTNHSAQEAPPLLLDDDDSYTHLESLLDHQSTPKTLVKADASTVCTNRVKTSTLLGQSKKALQPGEKVFEVEAHANREWLSATAGFLLKDRPEACQVFLDEYPVPPPPPSPPAVATTAHTATESIRLVLVKRKTVGLSLAEKQVCDLAALTLLLTTRILGVLGAHDTITKCHFDACHLASSTVYASDKETLKFFLRCRSQNPPLSMKVGKGVTDAWSLLHVMLKAGLVEDLRKQNVVLIRQRGE
jgi:hypothetical protein